MANPLPNEEVLYKRIKDEKMTIPSFVWDAMYDFLGDNMSFLNFQAGYYIEQGSPIPVEEAQKMLNYVMRSMEVVHKVIHPERITDKDIRLQKVKTEAVVLSPLIKEFYTHYLGNDLHIIGLCLQLHLDSKGSGAVPLNDALKIQDATLSIYKFLDRLREATVS